MLTLRTWVTSERDADGSYQVVLSYGVSRYCYLVTDAKDQIYRPSGRILSDLKAAEDDTWRQQNLAQTLVSSVRPVFITEAICEAVTRVNMRFVPIKTTEQQSVLMLHRTRHLFIRQQTSVINAIRAHLAEFGIVAPVGRRGVEELLNVVADPSDKRVPDVVRGCLAALGSQLLNLKKQILGL